VNTPSRLPWYSLLACVALAPLATTATSLALASLPLTYDSYVVPKLAALGVLAAIALVAWAAAGTTLRHQPGVWMLAAFLGLAGVATAFGLDPAVGVFGKDAANGLLAYLAYGAVFLLVVAQTTGTRRVTELSRAIIASGGVAAAATIYQALRMTPAYVTELGLGAVGYLYDRGGGLMGNPDYVGAFLVLPLVVGIGLTLAERVPGWRVFAGGTTLFMAAALLVTQVRAGWLGALVGVVLLAVLLLPRASADVRRRLVLAGGVLVVALVIGTAIAGPSLVAERLKTGAGQGLDAVSSGRISGWRDALAVIGDRPLTGTGPDSFTLGWYQHATALADPATGAQSYFEDPHNVYLAVAATMGIPAALALLALIFWALRSGMANLRAAAEHPEARTLYGAWLSAFGGLLVTALFAVTTIPTMLLLFVAIAVLLAPQARPMTAGPNPAAATRAAAAVLALVLAVTALIPLLADYQLGQYMRSGEMSRMERARSIAPWEKTIQTQYLTSRRAQIAPVLETGSADAILAATAYDEDAYKLVEAHPHELLYTLARIDFLGQAAGLLGPTIGEKALTVSGLATVDYPKLTDLKVYKARALNNLDRYGEAAELLEPLPRSVTRDMALTETLLLLGDETAARALAGQIAETYPASALAAAFLEQPTIRTLLTP